MKKKYIGIIVGVILMGMMQVQATLLVNEPFDGTTLNTNRWTAGGSAGFTTPVTGGAVTLNANSTANQSRAVIARTADDAGNATFNSAATFNFYDHALTLSATGLSLGGTASSGSAGPWYCLGVAQDAVGGANLYPVNADNGLFFCMKKTLSGTNQVSQLYSTRVVNGTKVDTVVGNMNGTLTGLNITMNGNAWTIDLTGANVLVGGVWTNTFSTNFTGISAANFSEYNLVAGTWNSGVSATAASLTIGDIQVTTIPEPSTLGLFVVSSLGLIMFRRRSRS